MPAGFVHSAGTQVCADGVPVRVDASFWIGRVRQEVETLKGQSVCFLVPAIHEGQLGPDAHRLSPEVAVSEPLGELACLQCRFSSSCWIEFGEGQKRA